jgi:hypothetical protein
VACHFPLINEFYILFPECLKNMTIEDHYGEAVEFIKKLFLDVRIPFWHFLGIKCFNGIFR